jgi:hypothetical protein
MRRRKFLAWVAGLPFVTWLFPKLVAKVKKPKLKTTEELKEICREILQRHLRSKFRCQCNVVVSESGYDKRRLGFTSLLSRSDLNTDLGRIANDLSMIADESKMSDIEVRILSMDRIDLIEKKYDEQLLFPLSLDTLELVIKEDGGWLVLKWDIGPEGFFERIRHDIEDQAKYIALDQNTMWLKLDNKGCLPPSL